MTTDTSAAGASAGNEYERRTAKDEKRTREQWVGLALDGIASESIRVLHDRRIPGSRANIDHIVITPGAVWVIDAKRSTGRPELTVEGGLIRPRVESLTVGGRNQTKLVEGVLSQAARVCNAIPGNPIRTALCFVDADWPLFGGPFAVRTVEVTWPKRLAERILATATGAVDVDAVAAAAEARLRPSA